MKPHYGIPNDLFAHAKVVDLYNQPRGRGLQMFGAWCRIGVECSLRNNGGKIPLDQALDLLGRSLKTKRREGLLAGLQQAGLGKVEGGTWVQLYWPEANASVAQRTEAAAKNAERQAKWRAAKKERSAITAPLRRHVGSHNAAEMEIETEQYQALAAEVTPLVTPTTVTVTVRSSNKSAAAAGAAATKSKQNTSSGATTQPPASAAAHLPQAAPSHDPPERKLATAGAQGAQDHAPAAPGLHPEAAATLARLEQRAAERSANAAQAAVPAVTPPAEPAPQVAAANAATASAGAVAAVAVAGGPVALASVAAAVAIVRPPAAVPDLQAVRIWAGLASGGDLSQIRPGHVELWQRLQPTWAELEMAAAELKARRANQVRSNRGNLALACQIISDHRAAPARRNAVTAPVRAVPPGYERELDELGLLHWEEKPSRSQVRALYFARGGTVPPARVREMMEGGQLANWPEAVARLGNGPLPVQRERGTLEAVVETMVQGVG